MKRPFLFSKVPIIPSYYCVEPEINLWRAVIDQAVQDWTDPNAPGAKRPDRKRAQVWLRGTSKDFWEVCNLACLDPRIVSTIINYIVGGRDNLYKD